MFETQNDLPSKTRRAVVDLLHAHLKALSGALADFGKKVRKAIDKSGSLGDADTGDLFTGISREVDKYLWFLEAHLYSTKR